MNVLSKAAIDLPLDATNIREVILESFEGIDKLYSYILYEQYKNGQLNGWRIEFMLSQEDTYNQISIPDIAKEIAELTDFSRVSEHRKILGYRQPGPEILLTAYEPLMRKLVKEEMNRWANLEYEDLMQTCRLVVMKLYRGGYYVHKRLLRRAFSNEILMSLRKERNKPILISLEQTIDGEDDKVTISDTIPDHQAIIEEQDMLDEAAYSDILVVKRDIIVREIGQRQYDQLVREYGNKSTTNWSRQTVQKLKQYLTKMGITEKTFAKYH